MGNLRQIGQIHAPDLQQRAWDQQQNSEKNLQAEKKEQKTKPS
jgi:hypothetical protein